MKRLTPELVAGKAAGRKLIGMIPLSTGGHGLLFEGDCIIDLRRDSLLDQAESVRERRFIERKLAAFASLGMAFPVDDPAPVVQRRRPQTVEAGGDTHDDAPEFDVPWEPTRAGDAERNDARMRRTSGKVIDDLNLVEGVDL